MPDPVSVRFVVDECSLVDSAVGELPPSLSDLVVSPLTVKFGSSVVVEVGAVAVLLPELPPARVAVLVGVDVGAFAMLDAVLPLTCIIRCIP